MGQVNAAANRRRFAWTALLVMLAATTVVCLPTTVAASAQQPQLVRPVVYVTSPWFPGVRYIGINYGCNATSYYPPSARCRHGQGFHHGVDLSMPAGTPVYSDVSGVAVLGGLGNAYGRHGLRIRAGRVDLVLGHLRRLVVHSGQRVHRGQLVAYSGASGAPDGAHLHFEVRPAGGSYEAAINPMRWLRATTVAKERLATQPVASLSILPAWVANNLWK